MNDKEKREKLHKLLDLVLDVNGFEERQTKLTGDKPTVFLNFSGHIALASVRILENGWNEGADYQKAFNNEIKLCGYGNNDSEDRFDIDEFNETIEKLQELKGELENGKHTEL